MTEAKVLTRHPRGKQGVNINRDKYEMMRDALIAALEREGPAPHLQLFKTVERDLAGRFDGSVGWYAECVKLDLEARGVVEPVRDGRRELLRLTGAHA